MEGAAIRPVGGRGEWRRVSRELDSRDPKGQEEGSSSISVAIILIRNIWNLTQQECSAWNPWQNTVNFLHNGYHELRDPLVSVPSWELRGTVLNQHMCWPRVQASAWTSEEQRPADGNRAASRPPPARRGRRGLQTSGKRTFAEQTQIHCSSPKGELLFYLRT